MEWLKCQFKDCQKTILKKSASVIGEQPTWVKKMIEGGYCMEHGILLFKEE
jgi:hypothetical protein